MKTRPESSNKFVLARRRDLDRRRSHAAAVRTPTEVSQQLASAGDGAYCGLQLTEGPNRAYTRGRRTGNFRHGGAQRYRPSGKALMRLLQVAPRRRRFEHRITVHWQTFHDQRQETLKQWCAAFGEKGIRELKVAAKKTGVRNYGRLNKAQLVQGIVRALVPHPCP